MNESQIDSAEDAAFFMTEEVVNEYHMFPVVLRADVGAANIMWIRLNEIWWRVEFQKTQNPAIIERLEELTS